MKNENDNILKFMSYVHRSNHFEIEDICKWKNESCKDCTDTNPFETQNFCHVAVKLYYADNNIVCPQCNLGYLRLTKGHYFKCPNCDHLVHFSFILKKQKKSIRISGRDQMFLLGVKK